MDGWACTAWKAWGPCLVQPLPSRAPLSPPSRDRDRGLGTGLRPSLWLCCPLAVAGFSLQLQVSDQWSAGPGTGPQEQGYRERRTRSEEDAGIPGRDGGLASSCYGYTHTHTWKELPWEEQKLVRGGRGAGQRWGGGVQVNHKRQHLLAVSATPGWSVCPSPALWPSLGQFWLIECGRSNTMQVPRLG